MARKEVTSLKIRIVTIMGQWRVKMLWVYS
jgi:hypothetical protein